MPGKAIHLDCVCEDGADTPPGKHSTLPDQAASPEEWLLLAMLCPGAGMFVQMDCFSASGQADASGPPPDASGDLGSWLTVPVQSRHAVKRLHGLQF